MPGASVKICLKSTLGKSYSGMCTISGTTRLEKPHSSEAGRGRRQ